MNHLISFKIFESERSSSDESEKIIEDFKKEYGIKVDPKFDLKELRIIKEAFSLLDKSLVKGKIKEIKLENLGAVHGKWAGENKKLMRLNPRIFSFKEEFSDDLGKIPYKTFIIVHEIGHSIDHYLSKDKETYSRSDEWKGISGWKMFPRKEEVPKGYKRYIERRNGRSVEGKKKSNWVHLEDADFCRKYSEKAPFEDFADSFAFAVFKDWDRFKGEGGKKKMEIIKKILGKN